MRFWPIPLAGAPPMKYRIPSPMAVNSARRNRALAARPPRHGSTTTDRAHAAARSAGNFAAGRRNHISVRTRPTYAFGIHAWFRDRVARHTSGASVGEHRLGVSNASLAHGAPANEYRVISRGLESDRRARA